MANGTLLRRDTKFSDMTHHPPYEPYYLAIPPETELVYSTAGDRNLINTLFISGLPDDVKAREIHNLFRRRPGFDSCQLKYTGRGSQVVAFATFVNHQSAMAALHSLNGVKFDPQTSSTLHIELARSNSRRKSRPGSGPYVVIDKRTQSNNTHARESSSEDGDSEPDDPATNVNKNDGSISDQSEGTSHGDIASAQENDEAEKTAADGACSTLFMANLGPNCTQEELKEILSDYPGFKSLKVRARGGMPIAFADFETVEQATDAMNALQGSSIKSSDRGGMHIDYARSKMRKP